MPRTSVLEVTPQGLYCRAGGFHLDPVGSVPRAVLTHAHGDHARPGHDAYFCAEPSLPLVRERLAGAAVTAHPYGAGFTVGDARLSFHPAGHVLGSAQVRIEAEGEVWVVSGDYKRAPDPTAAPFQVVPCDVFVTEATFALPIFRWDAPDVTMDDIVAWWDAGVRARRASVLFCYALGKAQRILAELARRVPDRSVFIHGAMAGLIARYREAGIAMLPASPVSETEKGKPARFAGELVLAPTQAMNSLWMRRFGQAGTAFASGWMRVRGTRRRRGFDRGFVVSDHADWPDLLRTIRDTGAERVLTTHGYADSFARYLREQGIAAGTLSTPFQGETED